MEHHDKYDRICRNCDERYGQHFYRRGGIDCPDSSEGNNRWRPSNRYASKAEIDERKKAVEMAAVTMKKLVTTKLKPIAVRIREGS
jgi:hypothetical protein